MSAKTNAAVAMRKDLDLLVSVQSEVSEPSELHASVQLLDNGVIAVVRDDRYFPLSIDGGGMQAMAGTEVVLDLGTFSFAQLRDAAIALTYRMQYRPSVPRRPSGHDKVTEQFSQLVAINEWLGWPSLMAR